MEVLGYDADSQMSCCGWIKPFKLNESLFREAFARLLSSVQAEVVKVILYSSLTSFPFGFSQLSFLLDLLEFLAAASFSFGADVSVSPCLL